MAHCSTIEWVAMATWCAMAFGFLLAVLFLCVMTWKQR